MWIIGPDEWFFLCVFSVTFFEFFSASAGAEIVPIGVGVLVFLVFGWE